MTPTIYTPQLWIKQYHYCSTKMALVKNNPRRCICHKTKKLNKISRRRAWFNGYRRKKCSRQSGFKSWMRMFLFQTCFLERKFLIYPHHTHTHTPCRKSNSSGRVRDRSFLLWGVERFVGYYFHGFRGLLVVVVVVYGCWFWIYVSEFTVLLPTPFNLTFLLL